MCLSGFKSASSLDPNVTLIEFGVDSLMTTEICTVLSEIYNRVVTEDKVRTMTFADLDQLASDIRGDDQI